MKTDLFQSCGHCWVLQICWHIECSTFTAPCFRIWNSSTGISSPPLALFIVMFPKAHLTSHSRMSGSRRVITPLWLFWLWRSFLYRSSVNSGTSLVAQMVKRLPTMRETWVRSLGQEDALEKGMAAHSSTLAWKIPWMEELGGYSPWGRKELDMTERLLYNFNFLCILATSSWYLLFLLGPYHFCPLLCPSLHKIDLRN